MRTMKKAIVGDILAGAKRLVCRALPDNVAAIDCVAGRSLALARVPVQYGLWKVDHGPQ